MFLFASPWNELIAFVSTDSAFVKIKSYCLNPSFVLNLCADVFLQSIITLIGNFCLKQFWWVALLVYLLGHTYIFYDLKDILMQLPPHFYDLTLIPYLFHVFDLTKIFQHYLLLLLHHFFHIPQKFQKFFFSLITGF